MHFIDDLTTLTPDAPTVLTIGKFDGVHRAHQQLVKTLVDRARSINAKSAVLTFDPHPDEVLRPERHLRYLTTINERAALLNQLGVDIMVVLHFNRAMASLTADAFMRWLCEHINLRELWIGPDFRLGYKAQGTPAVLAELGQTLGYTVQPIPQWTLDGEIVSSTAIRELLDAGDVAGAARYLGRPFAVTGMVVQGDQRGRTIGFPTANVSYSAKHMLPADGVYACRVCFEHDECDYPAVTNVGVRPTFGVLQRTVEAHIFDFNADVYDKMIQVQFIEHLRGERKFNGIQELVAQIQHDADQARKMLAEKSEVKNQKSK